MTAATISFSRLESTGPPAQYFGRECAKNLACAVPPQDLLAFPRSEHGLRVVLEHQREQMSEHFAILRPRAKQCGGFRQPGGHGFLLAAQPSPLAEYRGHVSARERIHSGVKFERGFRLHAGSSVPQAQPSRVTIACAAIASPWPIASTPSLVFAFKLIAEVEIPKRLCQAPPAWPENAVPVSVFR